jgi:hypothetical protein
MTMKTTTSSTRYKARARRLKGGVMSRSRSARPPRDDHEHDDDAQASMLAELEALAELGRPRAPLRLR